PARIGKQAGSAMRTIMLEAKSYEDVGQHFDKVVIGNSNLCGLSHQYLSRIPGRHIALLKILWGRFRTLSCCARINSSFCAVKLLGSLLNASLSLSRDYNFHSPYGGSDGICPGHESRKAGGCGFDL